MNLFAAILILPATLCAQMQIVPPREAPVLFAEKKQTIEIAFKNAGNETSEPKIRTQLFQASSATLASVGKSAPWKSLKVLSQQTVLENFETTFPAVRTATEFHVRFTDENERPIGELKIQVVPPDLLKRFSTMTTNPVGVLDPDKQLKPLLKKTGVEFHDLETGAGLDDFHGNLVILGPFRSKNSEPENLRKQVIDYRSEPLAIVWIQPGEIKSDPLFPICFVRENQRTTIIAPSDFVADLATSPKAQLNLLRAAELALHPETFRVPEH